MDTASVNVTEINYSLLTVEQAMNLHNSGYVVDVNDGKIVSIHKEEK